MAICSEIARKTCMLNFGFGGAEYFPVNSRFTVLFFSGVTLLEGACGQRMVRCPTD